MAALKQCEFFLLRYVPDALTEEFANIAVVLIAANNGDDAFAGVRFTRDWRRTLCLDPNADVQLLAAMEDDLRAQLRRTDRDTILGKLQDYCSNGIQFTSAKACLTADPAQELESLARMYLERPVQRGARRDSARNRILVQMRSAFQQAGVWQLMNKKIAAAEYTHTGDPLKIDCGYRSNGTIRLLHAVSLAAETDTAKVLAFSFPELRQGIARLQKATAELTAIVEPDLNQNDAEVSFSLAILDRSNIRVATVAELPEIAEQARRELRV